MIKKITLMLLLLCVTISIVQNTVIAFDLDDVIDDIIDKYEPCDVKDGGLLDNIIGQGNCFEDKGNGHGIGNRLGNFIDKTLIPAISSIGNLVFAAITVILGVKYIWSSAEGKSEVKETLPAYIAAIIFFYLAGSVYNLATGTTQSLFAAKNWTSVANYTIYIINKVVQYLSAAGIVFIGVKYYFASAEGRAGLKMSFGSLTLGMLFVFSTTTVISFVVQSAGSLL